MRFPTIHRSVLAGSVLTAVALVAVGTAPAQASSPLAFGFSGYYAPENWTITDLGSGGGSVNTVVLVLDRSASMELRAGDGEPSHRQSVLNKVADTIEKMGSPRLVLIDSASGEIQDVPSPDVLTDLSSTFATDATISSTST